MHKKFNGILLFKKTYKENDLFVKFLTDSDEIISGVVYGGLSRKKRNLYQVGYFLEVISFQTINKPASFKADLIEPYISTILNDKYKLNCLLSTISILGLSILEGQKIRDIYKTSYEFISVLINKKKWIIYYFHFLMNLLKIIGYQIDIDSISKFKFFDLNTLEFIEKNNNTSILFPFELLNKETISKSNFKETQNFFTIFETVYIKNHLSNLNLQLPNQYQLFKNLIIEYLSKK